ncbi:hypothetical protein BJ956_000993 [Arthrobacter psychrochitiniphilus]|nr:hypothetical protein [Arthrobacter psychrochitiniphilus]
MHTCGLPRVSAWIVTSSANFIPLRNPAFELNMSHRPMLVMKANSPYFSFFLLCAGVFHPS